MLHSIVPRISALASTLRLYRLPSEGGRIIAMSCNPSTFTLSATFSPFRVASQAARGAQYSPDSGAVNALSFLFFDPRLGTGKAPGDIGQHDPPRHRESPRYRAAATACFQHCKPAGTSPHWQIRRARIKADPQAYRGGNAAKRPCRPRSTDWPLRPQASRRISPLQAWAGA